MLSGTNWLKITNRIKEYRNAIETLYNNHSQNVQYVSAQHLQGVRDRLGNLACELSQTNRSPKAFSDPRYGQSY